MLLAIMIVPTLRAYLQQRAEQAALTEQIARQGQSLQGMQAEIQRWNDPAHVEQQARERLKFVRPGETAYQVIGAEKLLGDGLAGRSRVVVPNVGDDTIPWYGTMWNSIVIADRPDVDEAVPLTPVGERVLPGSSDPTAIPGEGGATGPTSSATGGATSGSTGGATGTGTATGGR
ncbi:hypothetical protein KILIM_002_00270 [Kineosphaera limosa NBRC 100340]|uniref:Septum formation initiator family protein n=1 Tax=Kineosphaera limosa NBRC 100340 TaxID=1184609 RepID=K6W4I5_9MICO|nr:hypothetical protein KILIM_002_00270 [Kineosphaera limosa NBRC 100340]